MAAGVAVVPAPVMCCSSPGVTRANADGKGSELNISSAFYGSGVGRSSSSVRALETRRRSSVSRSHSVLVRASKLPAGVEAPKEEPKVTVSLFGFTEKAEVWNSRAAMIGLFALVALEFFAHKGILQIIGVDIGKGLNLPL